MSSLSQTNEELELRELSSSADNDSSGGGSANQALFSEKVKQSHDAIQREDFQAAVAHYTEAIDLDPVNHILFSNRSAAYIKLDQYDKALKDALKAKELDPSWPKAFYREGVALQCLNRLADAVAAFSAGLALDARNAQLLCGLVDAASKSPIKARFQPTYQHLQSMKLDKNSFVIISVIGQDLLACHFYAASVVVLESALRIGTFSLKLRGSVFSALSSAHWGLKNTDQAIAYMQQDLSVAKSLGDPYGECRACGNLGSAFFSKGNFREALANHRCQLRIAMKLKLRDTAATALSNLGHVYTAIGDYPNSLASHKQCVLLVKQTDDKLWEAREIGNVGAVYTAMGDFTNALECHNEHLKIAKESGNKMEEARALSNLGSAYHYNRDYTRAIDYHLKVLQVSQDLSDKTLEARAYAGLGHAARSMNDLSKAKVYHEKQLDNALKTKDKSAEGRACSNIGIVYHQLHEYEAALKLHKKHLSIAKALDDRTSQGRAYGNIGNSYSALGQYDQAVKFHKQELAISKEVHDRHSEASTHGNLAVAYQALGMFEQALQHYNAHLNIARDLKDIQSEARALSNVGNYYSVRGEFTQAIPFYMQYLQLSQELTDSEGEARACHCLGFAHYSLGSYREAIRYYEQDLALAKDLKDQLTIARANCNLGLAYKSLGQYSQALEYQYHFLEITHTLKNIPGKFRAMGNIGDILINMQNMQEAVLLYNQQLKLAKQANDSSLQASAYGSLGVAHRIMAQYDKALGYHTQELNLRQELNDLRGECRAHGNLGNVHVSLGNYINGYKCYEEQLERAKEVKDSSIEAQACANLGITKMNLSQYEEAIGLFEQQLAMLEQVIGTKAMIDKGRAFGNLGECYEQLGDYEESIKCHEQYLVIAQNTGSLSDQDKAYRGLGNAHRSIGNLQQALVCFEKRLVVTHELDDNTHKGSAYGELGCLHSLLGNFDQAISCLEHQITLAREQQDKTGEGDACCGLGGVYQQMGEYEKALDYHKKDLRIAQEGDNLSAQCRAYGNLGLSYESQGEFQEALNHQEQHLSLAAQMNDRVAKTLAYSSLGRIHHALANYQQAAQYLRQGLQIAEMLNRREDEAKIRHRLGLALWANNELEESQQQLYKAAELFESIRREAHVCSDYKLSLFDLQTASYQALQRVLVSLGRHEEALVVAERGRTRAFVDLLLERQTGGDGMYGISDNSPVTAEQIMLTVNRTKSTVIYYSIAAGFLYSWLIVPEKGVVKFHECSVHSLEQQTEDVENADNLSIQSSVSILDQYVGQARELLGVDHVSSSASSSRCGSIRMSHGSGPSTSGVFSVSETDSDVEDVWQQQVEEMSGRLNAENDRTGFLRMVNRNHVFNSSNYSLGSLFSTSGGSLNGINTAPGMRRSFQQKSSSSSVPSRPPLNALYDLLITPMEDFLPSQPGKDLVLVLQGDLYLVPFALLKGPKSIQYLYERFGLLISPSLTSLSDNQQQSIRFSSGSSGAVVVGNPHLPVQLREQWHLSDLPNAQEEAAMVSDMLGVNGLTGKSATKEEVLRNIPNTEVIHIAAHVSWKLSSIVLSPSDYHKHESSRFLDDGDESGTESSLDVPSLSDYLLSAADILNSKLSSKLVVLSSGHTEDRAARINSDGVVGLTRALLAAGAKCVLYSLWPVPSEASRLCLRHFYTQLLQGHSACHALSVAMKEVQSVKQFSHPSNWAGWVLIGSDVKLSSKVAMMGQALCEILQTTNRCREAMRVLLHLIEKSLQRIMQGVEKVMYTTQESIESKVGNIPGWKELLTAVGFRFEPGNNGSPSVFFPLADPGERLTQCSTSLQALLAMPRNSLTPLAKLLSNYEAGEAIIQLLKELLPKNESSSQLKVRVKLWRVPGCHEFLASLGFDLVDVGKDEVTIRTGKQSSKRVIQFAVQALIILFNTQEAPRMNLAGGSSMESLNSSHSGSNTTTTSNFSKDSSTPHDSSTPPSSPHGKYYSPASSKLPAFRHQNARLRSPGSSLNRLKPILAVPHSPRGAKFTSLNVDDAFRFGSGTPVNHPEESARVIGIDNDDTPTDDACSVSSGRTAKPSLVRFPIRQASTNSTDHYATSSPSDSDATGGYLTHGPKPRRSALASSRTQRTRTPTRTPEKPGEKLRFPNKMGSDSRTRRTPDSDTSDGSASSSQTMTATSVKDPTALAFKIMIDTKPKLQAVEQMQQLSIKQNREETNRIRLEFDERTVPIPTIKSPEYKVKKGVHFDDERVKPMVAPKPRPRSGTPESLKGSDSSSNYREINGVRFSDPPVTSRITIEASPTPSPVQPTPRPPAGYDNESTTSEESLPPKRRAPPPYNIAVSQSSRLTVKHSRQPAIQPSPTPSTPSLTSPTPSTSSQSSTQPDNSYRPGNSVSNRTLTSLKDMSGELTDSREQLVDGSDQDDYSYENPGFDNYESSGGFSTNDLNRKVNAKPPSPMHQLPHHKTNGTSHLQKSNSMPKSRPRNNPPVAQARNPPSRIDDSQLDYVNVYEDESYRLKDERYVKDINNHCMEDLYPEHRITPPVPSRTNNNGPRTVSEQLNTWGYSDTARQNNSFYMTKGLRSSEC